MRRRSLALIAAATAVVAALAVVGVWVSRDRVPTTVATPTAPPEPVTLTWWHNGFEEPVRGFWRSVADEFEAAHPHVTIAMSGHLGQFDVPAEPEAPGPPDLLWTAGQRDFFVRAKAGDFLDLTDLVGAEAARLGGSAVAFNVDDRQYALPYTIGIEGFWYRKSLFARAGIATPPTTLAEFHAAAAKLKAAGIIPVVVDAASKWPATHFWYNFALRACSAETMRRSALELTFTDPCFVKAGADLVAFIATNPFQRELFMTYPCQCVWSETKLLVDGEAAMELMGNWYPGVVGDLATAVGADREAVVADLGWFPFPTVPGGRGAADAVLGGSDAFACADSAPVECVALLKYIVSTPVQRRFAALGLLPADPAAAAGEQSLPASMLAAQYDASYVQPWLDSAYGTATGHAMNDSIIELFSGMGSPEGIVERMRSAPSLYS